MSKEKAKTAIIVTNDEAKPIALSLKRVLEIVDVSTETCDHGNALNEFLEAEPDICVILNYEDKAAEAGFPGKKTYKIIKATAEPEQKVIRIGFGFCDYDDYLQAPFQLAKLYQLLGLGKKEE